MKSDAGQNGKGPTTRVLAGLLSLGMPVSGCGERGIAARPFDPVRLHDHPTGREGRWTSDVSSDVEELSSCTARSLLGFICKGLESHMDSCPVSIFSLSSSSQAVIYAALLLTFPFVSTGCPLKRHFSVREGSAAVGLTGSRPWLLEAQSCRMPSFKESLFHGVLGEYVGSSLWSSTVCNLFVG